MKVWSTTLTHGDLWTACERVNNDFPGCAVYLEAGCKLHEGPRVRRFDGVKLRSEFGLHLPNTGTNGAASYDRGYSGNLAASWTEWGWFLARVFEEDPDARCGDYKGAEDFHAQTHGRFIEPRTPRERQLAPHKLRAA